MDFVCTVFEQDDEMFVVYGKTIEECNLKGRWQDWHLVDCLLSVSKDFDLGWFLFLFCLNPLSAERYLCSKFVIIRWFIALNANYWYGVQTVVVLLATASKTYIGSVLFCTSAYTGPNKRVRYQLVASKTIHRTLTTWVRTDRPSIDK